LRLEYFEWGTPRQNQALCSGRKTCRRACQGCLPCHLFQSWNHTSIVHLQTPHKWILHPPMDFPVRYTISPLLLPAYSFRSQSNSSRTHRTLRNPNFSLKKNLTQCKLSSATSPRETFFNLAQLQYPKSATTIPKTFRKVTADNFPQWVFSGAKVAELLLLLFRLFSQMFILLHFLLPQKLLEGFSPDFSDCSIRALPISWPLNNSLLSFLEHTSLFSTHNWGWNMQRHLETCRTRFTFSLWPPPFLSSWLLFTSTHRPLLYKKNYSQKKLSHKFKKW